MPQQPNQNITPPNNGSPQISIDLQGMRAIQSATTQNIYGIHGTKSYNKFDVSYRYGHNEAFVRGNNQHWLGQLTNAAFKFIPSVIAKVGQGLSVVGESAYYALTGHGMMFTDSNLLQVYENGPLSNAFSNFEKWLDEAMPVHQSEKYLTSSIGSRFWTTSFFASDVADGLEFLASAYVPGSVISRFSLMGTLGKAGIALDKSSKIANIANKARSVFGVEKGLSGIIANTVYSTVSESLIEGKDAFEQMVGLYKQMHPEWTDELIEKKAAEHASFVVRHNLVALAVPNTFESLWLFGNASTRNIRKLVRQNKEVGTKLNLTRAILKGAMVEGGWEEGIQDAIQRYEEKIAKGIYDRDVKRLLGEYAINLLGAARGTPSVFTFNLLNIGAPAHTEQDRAAAAMLIGSLLGAGMSVYSEIREYNALKSAEEQEKALWAKILEVTDRARSIYVENRKNPYKMDKDSRLILDKDGAPIKDLDAIFNEIQDVYRRVDYALHAMNSAIAGDDLYNYHNKVKSLSALVYRLRSSGLSHEDFLDTMEARLAEALTDDDAKVLGIENELAEYREALTTLSELYDRVDEDLYTDTDLSDDSIAGHFNKLKKRTGFYYKALEYTLEKEKQIAKTDKAKLGLEELKQDLSAQYEHIMSNKETFKKIFLEAVSPFLERKKQIEQLEEELKSETDATTIEAKKAKIEELKFALHEDVASKGTVSDIFPVEDPALQSIGTITVVPTSIIPMFEPRLAKPYSLNKEGMLGYGRSVIVDTHIRNLIGRVNVLDDEEILKSIGENNSRFNNEIMDIVTRFAAETVPYISDGVYYNQDIQESINEVRKAVKSLGDKVLNASGLSDEELDMIVEAGAITPHLESYYQLSNILSMLDDVEALLEKSHLKSLELNEAYDQRDINGKYLRLVLDRALIPHVHAIINMSYKTLPNGERVVDVDNLPDLDSIRAAITTIKAGIDHYTNRQDINFPADPNFRQDTIEYLQSLLDKLNNLYEEAAKASVNREARQKEIEQRFVDGIYRAVKIHGTGDLLGALEKELSTFKVSPDEASFGQITHALGNLKEKSPELSSAIDAAMASIMTEVKTILQKYPDAADIVKLIESGHTDTIRTIMSAIKSVRTGNLELAPQIVSLADSADIVGLEDFIKTIDKTSIPEESLKDLINLINLARLAIGLDYARSVLSSSVKISSIATAMESLRDHLKLKPTREQTIATMYAVLKVYSSNAGDSLLANVPVVLGAAGTGKTTGVTKWILSTIRTISHISEEEVMYSGHSEYSTEVLKDTYNTEKVANIDQLASKDLSKVKLLLIDEVFAANPRSVEEAIVKAKKDNPHIKIILSGDILQSSFEAFTSKFGTPSYEAANKDVKLGLPVLIPTLTVNYRTNIFPIVNAANQFKNKSSTPEKIDIYGNTDTQTAMDNPAIAYGVYDMKADKIIQMLSRPSSASRALIVEDEATADKYRSKVHSDVKVIPISKVHGTTFEEVYVILPRPNLPPNVIFSPLLKELSSKLYTAITRASKMAVVDFETSGVTTTGYVDPNISLVPRLHPDELESISSGFSKFVDDLLGRTGEVSPESPEKAEKTVISTEKEPTQEEIIEEEDLEKLSEELPSIEIPDITIEEPTVQQGSPDDVGRNEQPEFIQSGKLFHKLLGTNNLLVSNAESVRHITENIDWTKARLVTGVIGSGESLTAAIAVIVPDKNDPDSYYTAAVLTEEDLSGTEIASLIQQKIGVDSRQSLANYIGTKKNIIRIASGSSKVNIRKQDVEEATIMEVKIEDKNPLTTYYSDSRTTIEDTLKNFLLDVLPAKYSEKYRNMDARDIYHEFFSGPNPKAAIRIYNKREAAQIATTDRYNVEPGRVYLVLKNIQGTEYKHNLYIELQPNKLSALPNNNYYATIKRFVDIVDSLMDKFSYTQDDVYDLIDQASKLFVYDEASGQIVKIKNTLGDKGKYDILVSSEPSYASMVDELVKLTYGPKRRVAYKTVAEYEAMAKSDPSVVGFIPASNNIRKHKLAIDEKLRASLGKDESLPRTIEEYRKLGLQIPDDAKVKVLLKKDVEAGSELLIETQLVKNAGPLQSVLNALATSNKSIARNISYVHRKDDGSTTVQNYRVAPPAISTSSYELKVSKQYFTELRNLQKDIMYQFMSNAVSQEGVELDEQELKKEYKIHGTVEKLDLAIESFFERAKSNPSKYGFADATAAEAAYMRYNSLKDEITRKYSIKTVSYADIKGLLESAFIPIRRDNTVKDINASNVRLPSGAEDIRQAISSRFHGAKPASITISVDIAASKQSVKTEQKKTTIPKPSDLDPRLADLWEKSVVSSKTVTARDLINSIDEASLSNNNKLLLDIIKQYDRLDSIRVTIADTKDNIVVAYTKPKTDSVTIIGSRDNVDYNSIVIHELIHAITLKGIRTAKVSPEKASSADIELYRTVSTILNEARKEAKSLGHSPDDVLFADTLSEKTEEEFIASLSNERVWNYLSNLKGNIIQRIFQAITNFLFGSTNTSVAELMLKSFEKYVVSKSSFNPTSSAPKSITKLMTTKEYGAMKIENAVEVKISLTTRKQLNSVVETALNTHKTTPVVFIFDNEGYAMTEEDYGLVSFVYDKIKSYDNAYMVVDTDTYNIIRMNDVNFAVSLENLGLLKKRCA